jgi:hypothetical protein
MFLLSNGRGREIGNNRCIRRLDQGRAYNLWRGADCPESCVLETWLRAERELTESVVNAKAAGNAKAAARAEAEDEPVMVLIWASMFFARPRHYAL